MEEKALKVRSYAEGIRATLAHHRRPLVVAAAVLFAVGLGWSFQSLELGWNTISYGPILVLFFALAPASLALGAVSLQLTARVLDKRMGFRDAFMASAIARVAEILPIPGGAMARGGALVRAGAGVGESAWIVTLTALLTLSMAAAFAGLSLLVLGRGIGYAIMVVALAGLVVSAGWLATKTSLKLTIAMVSLRVLILAISAFRMIAAFAVIGFALSSVNAALFVICASIGGAIAVVPAGLGVSETVAAGLAYLVEVPPAAAFLAVAINRIVGIALNGAVALMGILAVRPGRIAP